MVDSKPMTTAGLQAKVRLRQVWFEAHPNQPMPEGRLAVDRLIADIEAEAARNRPPIEDRLEVLERAVASLTTNVRDHEQAIGRLGGYDEPLVSVRAGSGGVFPDGTTNHPAIDFIEPPVISEAVPS